MITAFGEQQVAELTPMAGWTFAYNVNADLVATTLAGSGAVTNSAGFAVLSTTAAADSSAKIETRLPVRYIPGQGGLVRFAAVFTEGVAGSSQIIGVGDDNDGFFFGYNGATFGVMRRRDNTDYWTALDDWENAQAAFVQALDPTKNNVYQIQFQWLSAGEIRYFVEDPAVGGFERVHRIKYANSSVDASILNPTLPVMAEVANTTNETAIVLKTPSAMGFCEGKVDNPSPPHPLALPRTRISTKAGVSTQANIITLQNPTTWQGKANRIRAQVRNLSVAVEGAQPVTIRLVKNTTLGGTPSYAAHSANTSPINYDTAGTTLTGGDVVFSVALEKLDSAVVNLDTWGVFLNPGDTLTVSAESGASTDVTAAVNWSDLI